jgi:membrane protease YdiL (CAAX protease family)
MMNPITSLIKRYPQATFWGIVWSTFFFGRYMMATTSSELWGFLIYSSFLTGMLVTAIADGRSGLKTYFSRMVRWRVGIQWYAAAFFLPLVLRTAAFGLNVVSGGAVATDIQWPAWSDLLMGFLWPSFFGIALAEEPGFRGFALPRLMAGRSALAASLVLGVLHAVWHFPLFLSGEALLTIVPIILAGAVVNTWLFNHTNGSVLLAMLMHSSVDVALIIFNPFFTGAAAEMQTVWLAVVYVGMAILLPLLTGKELGRKPEPAMETAAVDRLAAAK